MKKHIGVFALGYENVELRIDTELAGGNFYLNPRSDKIPVITVGFASYTHWPEVANVLSHEAWEMALARHNVRWQGAERFTPDHASYLFIFDHCQFTEICGMATNFYEQTRQKVRVEWGKHVDKKDKEHKDAKRQAKLKAKAEAKAKTTPTL